MMTNREHDQLWRDAAKALVNLSGDLYNVKLKLKLNNYREIAKDLYAVGEISKEDYVSLLKILWNDEENYGKFEDVFRKEMRGA